VAWFARERKVFGSFELPGLVDIAPRLTDATIGILGALLLFVSFDVHRYLPLVRFLGVASW
jgi:hypothetical protein